MTPKTLQSPAATAQQAVVSPFEGVTDHRGEPRPPDRELFAAPPPEIGRVLSAESTLPAGKGEYPLALRLFVIVAPAALAGGLVLWFGRDTWPWNRDLVNILAAAAALVLALIAWYVTRFTHRCSYVGEDGAALFKLKGRRDATEAAQVLVYAAAAELRASQTRHFYNGVYTGTSYDFRWSDAAGRQLLKLGGKYMGKDAPPKPDDAFHFAAAAEMAWSMHYLDRAQGQLEREGSIAFPVDRGRVVRVGPGFMEFHFGGEPVRVTAEEIGKVSLAGGHFSFAHKDAKWYRSAGKFNFPYGRMANGKVFFLALDKLMGYRWE